MKTLLFVISHYSILVFYIIISFIIGRGILKGITIPNNSGKLFVCTSLGLGVLIMIIFTLSLLNIFTSLYISIAILFSLILSVVRVGKINIKNDFILFYKKIKFYHDNNWVILYLLIMIMLGLMLLPLYPPTAWDEVAYHLPYAKYYVNNQGLAVNYYLRYPLYAHNYDLLYSLALITYDDILAHLFHWLAAILTAIGIYSLGSVIEGKKVGIIAALLFISTPVVISLMKTSSIDLGLTLFVFLCFYSIILWKKTDDRLYFFLSSVSIGLAIGSKYLGLLYFLISAIFFIYYIRRVKYFFYFIIIALVIGFPWYIRNIFISGNPLSPFASELFGYWIWSESDLIRQKNELIGHGVDRNLLSFITLPWYLITEKYRFREQLTPLLLIWYPFIPIFFRLGHLHKAIMLYMSISLFAWFYGSQLVRYLLATLPVMSLSSSYIMVSLVNFLKINKIFFLHKFKIKNNIFLSFTIILTIFLLFSQFNKKPIPINNEMRNIYLNNRTRYYALIQEINKYPDNIVYQLGFEDSFYFSKNQMIGDWFGKARYSDIFRYTGKPDKIKEYLKKVLGVDMLLVNKHREGFVNIYQTIQLSSSFTLIFENKNGAIYKIN